MKQDFNFLVDIIDTYVKNNCLEKKDLDNLKVISKNLCLKLFPKADSQFLNTFLTYCEQLQICYYSKKYLLDFIKKYKF